MNAQPDDLYANGAPTDFELDRLVSRARDAFRWRAQVDEFVGFGALEGVTARVRTQGGLIDLKVDDEACANGGEAVAGRILSAIAAAQQHLSEQIRESGRQTFGEGSDWSQTIEEAASARFSGRGSVLGADDS
ncbi:hypothetical protein BCF74_10644 [Knoellia remsis]|uniref:YbaB/EbfC DNA-binding family protein n=1 Tax=Knoellia remsis TaxID=407159 RepID=A0A2T0UTP2_9MICO|nr:hypothetical protein [Knoellia remsis]PRY61296.1 hypothetical protein BCF74_10644 [Knoellia remsis]